ncbi:unnamed protein product [Trichogramma brassicae]|uniref:Uncharacterized protein n=1 Tax=Trichogramma brassicae TaxID=86971 RepID=A0A6H5HU16_9HYME|nr:unnamed protein product [Trichogramma brassicae]
MSREFGYEGGEKKINKTKDPRKSWCSPFFVYTDFFAPKKHWTGCSARISVSNDTHIQQRLTEKRKRQKHNRSSLKQVDDGVVTTREYRRTTTTTTIHRDNDQHPHNRS